MVDDAGGDKKRCFIVTPIGEDQSLERRHANMVFEVALRPVVEELKYTPERADMSTSPGQITADIFSALNEAAICIADLTFLNANVMYELGVRHALQKPVIQIAAKGTRLPFDTSNQRTIFFEPSDVHSLQKLGLEVKEQIRWVEANPGKVSNPLTSAISVFANAVNADPQSEMISQIVARVNSLEDRFNNNISAAIFGQGDLATKNEADLRNMWRVDQKAQSLKWERDESGHEVSEYRKFTLRVAPESKGRWSSSAVEKDTGYSVPWPIWQSSSDDAKTTIVKAVDAALAERGS